MTERCRWTVYFRVTGRVLKIQIIQGWQRGDSVLAAKICTGPHNRLLRRQHCSSLCSQSEGHEHVANMVNTLGYDFVGFLAVFGRHNIRSPSLCEQSELQCFASNLCQMFARCTLQRCRTRYAIWLKTVQRFIRVRGCGGVERCTTWRQKRGNRRFLDGRRCCLFGCYLKTAWQMRVNRCVAAFRASQFREKAVYK